MLSCIRLCDADHMMLMSNLKGSTITAFKITVIILRRGIMGLNQGLLHGKHALCHWVTPSAMSFSHGEDG